jgi:hypothetical protein
MGVTANLNPVVVAADLAGFEDRQAAGLDQTGIFPNGPLNGAVNGNAIVVQFFQGATADTSHDNPIHRMPPQGCHGVAGTMLMVLVRVREGFYGIRIQIHKDKKRRRPEMAVNVTIDTLVFNYRKSDFHVYCISLIKC